MAAMQSISMAAMTAPGEPCSLDHDTYMKDNQWGPPVVPATRFSTPSSSSSSTTSSGGLTLYEDEDGWYDFGKADADSLASDSTDATSSSQPSTSSQALPLTHAEWLHQFAEQARRAHMRNVARSLQPEPCQCLSTAAYPETEYKKPEPALLQVKQPWLTPFRRGCVTIDSKARRVHAQSVVAQGEWDADGLHGLFDVGDFVLLLLVRLHLVDLVLGLCPDVRRVVTTIVHQLLLEREIHDVRANRVHEVL